MTVIARVRLAPGQVGFFDELTRIHLTIQEPEKPVLKGMNTSILKVAVKSGRILLVSGTLDPETNVQQDKIANQVQKIEVKVPAEIKVETIEEVKAEEVKAEEVVEVEQPAEEIVEEVIEEVKGDVQAEEVAVAPEAVKKQSVKRKKTTTR